MKTDYRSLGSASLAKLRYAAEHAQQIQQALLLQLMDQNKDTAYGRRYGFGGIDSLDTYQKRVPISTYSDYQPYIERLQAGEKNQLTREEPVYYCISSGSVGEPKYEPLTESDIRVHYDYAYGAVFGMMQEYYPDLEPEDLFGRIFQVGEFARTFQADGMMNGIRSSSLYQWLDRDGTFDASDYCVPKEVLFPDSLEDLTYIRARFALADREIRAVHGVFIHRMVDLFYYIETHWDLLLRDMEQGSVDDSIPISDAWKTKVKQWLAPDPERAAQLRRIPAETLSHGMVRKIWNNVRYILCIGGSTFSVYKHQMQEYARNVPIHYFAYAASEGIFGLAYEVNRPDAYVLLPDAGIFEFLPVKKETGLCAEEDWQHLVSLTEVCVGETYELIFTNLSGLYRYRMMDVIEVIGFFRNTPIIRFCYRKNQVLNIADEKMDMEQMEHAMRLFRAQCGCQFRNYCVEEVYDVYPGHYRVYAERERSEEAGQCIQTSEELSQCMDVCLGQASVGYRGCRSMNELGPAEVCIVPEGSFAAYDRLFRSKGYETEQSKPVRLLDTSERRNFFAGLAGGKVE